ncbi:MAG: porin [Ideonella sp.]
MFESISITAKGARSSLPLGMQWVRRRMLAHCLIPILLPSGAAAEGLKLASDLSFSGFGTLGLTHSSTDEAEFRRDILQPRGVTNNWSGDVDSRIGLQVNARLNAEIDGMAQAVSSYDHAGSYRPELTWAFVRYSPSPSFEVRAGRLGADVYMRADSRNIGYSNLWVRPPVEYFGQLQISHIDGADAVYRLDFDGGIASAKLYAGRARQKIPVRPGEDYDLDGTRVLGSNLDYQKGAWQFRAGYTSLRLKSEVPVSIPLLDALRESGSPAAVGIAADLSFVGKTLKLLSAGVIYESGTWQSQLMFNRLISNTVSYPQKDSGYFLLGYRSERWTPFAMLAVTRSKSTTRATGLPTPNPLDAAVSTALANGQSRQRTQSLGVRYDLVQRANLTFQLDRVKVQDNATLLWRNPQPGWNGRATIFSMTLDFVF